MSRRYRFTPGAEEDLLAIWLHTDQRWGEAQADRYQDTLHDACQLLADGSSASRLFDSTSGVRFHRCEHHYLFFIEQPDGITVLAVLHERMDLPARLRERLARM